MEFPEFVSRVFGRINKLMKRQATNARYMPDSWDNFYGLCYKSFCANGTVGRTANSALPLIKTNRI